MKRRLFALLLALAMVFSLAGCTQDPQPTETTAAPTTAQTDDTPVQGRAAPWLLVGAVCGVLVVAGAAVWLRRRR